MKRLSIFMFFFNHFKADEPQRDAQTCVQVAAAALIPGHPKGHSEVTSWSRLFLPPCQVLDEIAERGIKIYQLPDADSDEDEEFKEQTRVLKVCVEDTVTTHTSLETDTSLPSLSFIPLPSIYPQLPAFSPIVAYWFLCFPFQASIPFAVIGSNQLIEVKGKKIRGRLYPWGVVEVENPEHNDFLKLRTMLVWVSADSEVLKWLKGFQRETAKSQTPVSLRRLQQISTAS